MLFQIGLRFPLEYKNPYAYLLPFATQYLLIMHIMMISTSLLSVVFGIYFIVLATTEVIKRSIQSINDQNKSRTKRKRNRKLILNQFKQLIEYQSVLKQLSNRTTLRCTNSIL